MSPRASFVVVNWRTEAATRACVASIRAQDADAELEIIVVDNESTPASRAALEALGVDALLTNDRNTGFTGAMNQGFAAATGSVIAAVNNDLVLHPSWLRVGLAELADPTVGVVGGVEYLLGEHDPAYDTANPCYTYCRVDPKDGYASRTTEAAVTGDVVALDGNNLLLPADLARRLGGFADDFFAYYEDVDLCARALACGRRVRLSAEMRVWHRRNLSSDRIPLRRHLLAQRNHLRFVARHFPEATWRRTVHRLSVQYVVFGVLGRQSGLRSRGAGRLLPPGERLVSIASGAWGLSHGRAMERSRRRLGELGQRSDDYAARLGAQR